MVAAADEKILRGTAETVVVAGRRRRGRKRRRMRGLDSGAFAKNLPNNDVILGEEIYTYQCYAFTWAINHIEIIELYWQKIFKRI